MKFEQSKPSNYPLELSINNSTKPQLILFLALYSRLLLRKHMQKTEEKLHD